MNNLQKLGGITALLHSAAYLIGIVMYFAVLSPILDASPSEYVAQLATYQTTMTIWIFIAYWVSGFSMVVVALALYERLKSGNQAIMQIATALGIIWGGLIIASGNLMMHGFDQIPNLYATNPAQAETISQTLSIVGDGLISGNELIGGLWILMLSWSALQSGELSKGLNYFGILISVSGVLTMFPPIFEATGTFFGLAMIVWFAWLGIFLLRNRSSIATGTPDAMVQG